MARIYVSALATLLMLLISLSPKPTTANDDDIAVLDTNGNPLVAGEFYYAVPATESSVEGGLTMFNNDSPSCPEFIVSQSKLGHMDVGIPLVFFPQDPEQTYIQHGFSDYNIAFKYLSILPECRRLYTTVWTVSTETPSNNALVVLDGEKGDQISWFKIKKSDYNNGYTIRYSSSSLGGSVSKDVGVVSNEQGVNLLSLDDSAIPLVVVFVKAG
ncbi:21 kDa seed protein-like [Silene latifolia]|uniref:21 kDa seed protein-like n=1 Tax=Silene latifolia TaxID=37657 RepID=UPI003D78A347